MSTTELKTIGTGTDAMIAQATEAMESFRPMVAKVREHELLTVEANGIGKVSDARKGLKRLRVDIDKKRSELNKGALEFQRTVNNIAKELTRPVEEVEEILQAREDAHEAKKEAERRAKFEAEEAARLAAERATQEKKQARVNQMIEAGVALDWAAADLSDESWHVWFGIAVDEAKIRKERSEYEARIAREAEAKERAERERIAEQMRIEQEAETKRQAEELRIRAEEIERQRLADEAILDEQRKVMEAEKEYLRQQQEEIRKAVEAKAKAEREAAEHARAEALKPEIEKAHKFAQMMSAEAAACLNTLGLPDWSDDALAWVKRCGQEVISIVEQR
jgi:hypothetical protein